MSSIGNYIGRLENLSSKASDAIKPGCARIGAVNGADPERNIDSFSRLLSSIRRHAAARAAAIILWTRND